MPSMYESNFCLRDFSYHLPIIAYSRSLTRYTDMKILCSKSGIEFTAEHFPGTFFSRELSHPIFSLEQKKLLSYTGKWAAGELTPTDSYLLFLALLNSSEQIQFRTSCKRTPLTNSIVANNMEYLVRTVIKLNAIRTPGTLFPYFDDNSCGLNTSLSLCIFGAQKCKTSMKSLKIN